MLKLRYKSVLSFLHVPTFKITKLAWDIGGTPEWRPPSCLSAPLRYVTSESSTARAHHRGIALSQPQAHVFIRLQFIRVCENVVEYVYLKSHMFDLKISDNVISSRNDLFRDRSPVFIFSQVFPAQGLSSFRYKWTVPLGLRRNWCFETHGIGKWIIIIKTKHVSQYSPAVNNGQLFLFFYLIQSGEIAELRWFL